MKKYIILSGSVDGATCEDDGFVNCASFDLADSRAYGTSEEAIAAREQIIETDLEEFKTLWTEEDGYELEVGSMGKDPMSDKYLDVRNCGEVVNETTYKIAEVEF